MASNISSPSCPRGANYPRREHRGVPCHKIRSSTHHYEQVSPGIGHLSLAFPEGRQIGIDLVCKSREHGLDGVRSG